MPAQEASTDSVRLLLEELHGHAFELRQKWTLYQELYGNQKRVEVMRAAAYISFGILQAPLWESIFMAIFRLLDRARSSGKDTASLEQLIKAIPAGHAAFCTDLTHRLATLRAESEPITQWRHNRIAHTNLKVVMMQELLDTPTIQGVHQAVGGIEDFHRRVGDYFYPSESWSFQGEPVDADIMMLLLEEGLKHRPPLRFPPKGH
jgi:hypothetical protein